MDEKKIAGIPVIPEWHHSPNSREAAICAQRDKLRWQDDTRESGFVKAETLDAPL